MIISFRDNTSGMHWDNQHGENIDSEVASSTFDNYINLSKVHFKFLIIILFIYLPYNTVKQTHGPLSHQRVALL
jgi:hypothetical protein